MKLQRARLTLLALSFFVFVGASECDEKSQPAVSDEIINGFAQGCSLGPWTRAALDRASTITSVYESLKDKAKCKGANLDRALGAANALEMELRALEADEARAKERKMEEASHDLMLLLSDPSLDADAKSSLMGYYATARYELSLARADANYVKNPGYKARMTLGLERVNGHLRDLLSASDSLAECYQDNPSVAIQLGASLAELGGAFAPPLIGLGVSAVSNLVKLAVEAVRLAPSAEAIYDTHRARMPIAMACGLEALTRDYCKARDARTLLAVENKGDRREILPFFFGVDLQDRHLPILYAWLDRVVNGTDNIRDSDQAGQLNFQYARILVAQNSKRSAQGHFADTKEKIDRGVDASTAISYIRNLIRGLVSTFFQCSMNGGTVFACSDAVFAGAENAFEFVTAIAPNGVPQGITPDAGHEALITALEIKADDLEVIRGKFEELYRRRYSEVVRDFNENVNVDLPSLVRAASRVSVEGLSPLSALERLYQFLEQYRYPDGPAGQRDEIIIRQLRAKLDRVYVALIDPDSVSDEEPEIACPDSVRNDRVRPQNQCFDVSPAAKAIAVTFETFKLENNNVYLPGVLQGLVETDLTTRYLKGEGPRSVDDLFRLAEQDLSLLLQRTNLTPARVLADLSAAQSLSSRNVAQFREFFAPALARAMNDLHKAAEEFKEPAAGDPRAPNRNMLSQLCVLTYVSGMGWPEGVDPALCRGAKLVSKEARLEWDMESLEKRLEGMPLDERICQYEEFLRLDRLANLNLKRPGEPRRPDQGESSVWPLGAKPANREAHAFWQSLIAR